MSHLRLLPGCTSLGESRRGARGPILAPHPSLHPGGGGRCPEGEHWAAGPKSPSTWATRGPSRDSFPGQTQGNDGIAGMLSPAAPELPLPSTSSLGGRRRRGEERGGPGKRAPNPPSAGHLRPSPGRHCLGKNPGQNRGTGSLSRVPPALPPSHSNREGEGAEGSAGPTGPESPWASCGPLRVPFPGERQGRSQGPNPGSATPLTSPSLQDWRWRPREERGGPAREGPESPLRASCGALGT